MKRTRKMHHGWLVLTNVIDWKQTVCFFSCWPSVFAQCILWISVNCMHKINGLNYLFKQIVVNNDVGDDLNAIDGGIPWKNTWRKNQQRTKRHWKNAQSEVSFFFFSRCVLRTTTTTTAVAEKEHFEIHTILMIISYYGCWFVGNSVVAVGDELVHRFHNVTIIASVPFTVSMCSLHTAY